MKNFENILNFVYITSNMCLFFYTAMTIISQM